MNTTPVSVTNLIEMDFAEVRALGKSLAAIARENPKAIRAALGMQVRNTQKTIAATVRKYRIQHKVNGKQQTVMTFPKRHPITVSLHGRAGGGKMGVVRSVSVSSIQGGFRVGYKGGLQRYAERWQDGGKTGLFRDKAANRKRYELFKGDWDAALREPDFAFRVYRVLGAHFGIHTPEELENASADTAGPAFAVLRAMVFKKLREGGNALLQNPKTWQGRPFIEPLADDLRERFAPGVAAILEKTMKKELARR